MVPTHVCSHLLLLLLLSTSVNSDESNEGIDDKQPSYEDDCLVVKTTDNNHQSSTIAMTRTDTLSSKRHRQLSASTPHYRYSTPSVPTSPSPPPFPTPFRKPTSLGHPERYPIPSAPYEPPSSRSPTKASNEPSIIFEPSASPSTSGDVCNKLDPNSEEFLNDTCCSRENRCEDYQYCIGVMMAHESAALSQCCDQYDSCSQFRELLRTMRYLRRLAIADTAISAALIVLVVVHILNGCWASVIGAIASYLGVGFVVTHLGLFLACFAILDAAVEIAEVSLVVADNGEDFAHNLLFARCFVKTGDEAQVGKIKSLLADYIIVVGAEIGGDVVAAVLHCFSANPLAWQDIVGYVLDVQELIAAVIGFALFLRPSLDALNALHNSMDPTTMVPNHEACIHTCCGAEI